MPRRPRWWRTPSTRCWAWPSSDGMPRSGRLSRSRAGVIRVDLSGRGQAAIRGTRWPFSARTRTSTTTRRRTRWPRAVEAGFAGERHRTNAIEPDRPSIMRPLCSRRFTSLPLACFGLAKQHTASRACMAQTPWVTTAKSNRSLKSGANHPRRCMHGARLRYRGATKAEFPERAGTVDAVSQCRDPSPESPRASLRSAISSEGGVAQ